MANASKAIGKTSSMLRANEIPFAVLSKLISSLNEADNKLSGESELHFLQTLLQSKEINALVNVHHKVAKVGKDDRIAPILSASMQVKCTHLNKNLSICFEL